MNYDIYGHELATGHCEVHPDVQHPYPCPCCYDDGSDEQQYPEPCQGCFYAVKKMQVCDGTCQRIPQSEWAYFRDSAPVGEEAEPKNLAGEENRQP